MVFLNYSNQPIAETAATSGVKVGAKVWALWDGDNEWSLARVTAVNGNKVKVRWYYYGRGISTVDRKNVRVHTPGRGGSAHLDYHYLKDWKHPNKPDNTEQENKVSKALNTMLGPLKLEFTDGRGKKGRVSSIVRDGRLGLKFVVDQDEVMSKWPEALEGIEVVKRVHELVLHHGRLGSDKYEFQLWNQIDAVQLNKEIKPGVRIEARYAGKIHFGSVMAMEGKDKIKVLFDFNGDSGETTVIPIKDAKVQVTHRVETAD